MPLNDKQALFVQEYLIDPNATQAAIRAGYSEGTARQQGCRLLTDADIQAAIQEAKRIRSEQTGIDAIWVLKRLAEEAEADLADLYTEEGGLKPIHQWPAIWRKGLVAGIKVHQEFDYVDGEKVPDGVVKEIKLSDRIKRLELIGKHIDVGAFAEKHEHSVGIYDMTEEELDRRIAARLAQQEGED